MSNLTLQTHAPSLTTVSYTVSSAPQPRLFITRLLKNTLLVLRLCAAAVCFLATVLQCKLAFGFTLFSSTEIISWAEDELQVAIARNAGGGFGAVGAQWWVLSLVGGILAWGLVRRYYIEESLLVVRGLGIQTASSGATYLEAPSVRFIATSQIQDIFIHEAFIGFEVRFYLAVVVEGEENAVVVFPKSLPRREVLEQVWRGAREVLGWSRVGFKAVD